MDPQEPQDRKERKEPTAAVDGAEIALTFDYHPGWVAAIKRLPRRRWDPAGKRWLVPRDLAPELVAGLTAAEAPAEWLVGLQPEVGEAIARTAAAAARARRVWETAVPSLRERWPDLFAHQREGVAFLLTPRPERGAILADEMGLGKTRQAIVAAREAYPDLPVLVACPAALTHHWAREIRRVAPDVEVTVAGSGPLRVGAFTVVSYDRLARHQATLADWRFGMFILDEAHYVKNGRARRSKLVWGEAGAAGLADACERLVLLTGTPVANRPLDLFPLLRGIRHPLGDDKLAFGLRYCDARQNAFGWDLKGASNLDDLRERLRGVLLRRVKEEVLDLPPKLRTYMPVDVDLDAYRRVWTAYLERAMEAVRSVKGRRKRVPKYLVLAELAKLRHAAAVAKIPAALALAEALLDAEEKAVVFTCHRAVVAAFRARFGDEAVFVVGGQSARTRQAAVDAFESATPSRGPRLLVGDVRAAGHGFTLASASQVVFVDYAWTPAEHLQAEDRAHRIGQRRSVTVTYLSAVGTIDEDIERILGQKLEVAARLIDGAQPAGRLSFLDDLLAVVTRDLPPG